MKNIVVFLFLIVVLQGCEKTNVIESKFVRVNVLGNIMEGDWLEVNDYRINFTLPDTSLAIAYNVEYSPFYLQISKSDDKVGLLSPSLTYQSGPKGPVEKKVTKGMMLYNIGKLLNILSFEEFDSAIFDFRTDKIAAFNGLLVFGMVNGENVRVRYPDNMNVLVEPYEPKN